MFEEINVEYVILIALLIILGFYIYKERNVVEGADDTLEKDPQYKELQKKLKEMTKKCAEQKKKVKPELMDAFYMAMLSNEECQSFNPVYLTDEMYEGLETILLDGYNEAGDALVGKIAMITAPTKEPSIWSGYFGAKSPEAEMQSVKLQLDLLLTVRKACLESLQYLQEGDTVDADGIHSIYETVGAKKSSGPTASSSSGLQSASAFKSSSASAKTSEEKKKAAAKEAQEKAKAKAKAAAAKAKAKAEAAKAKAKLKSMF